MDKSFIEEVIVILKDISEVENKSIIDASKMITRKIESGGIIHMFGCGHSHILAEEFFYRAGGLACISPIFHEPLMLHEGAVRSSQLERKNDYAETFINDCDIRKDDVMIVLSTSGRNPVPVDVALYAKDKGADVIVFTSKIYSYSQPSRHKENKRLFDVGDIVIDNHAPIGDALLKLKDFNVPFEPVSTITSAAILHEIFSKSIQSLSEKGIKPPVFLSGNIEGADDYNNELVKKYSKRIPLLIQNAEIS